ncbi:DUF167 domain-containing protein [Sphaerotilus mobilis]|uniref:UPF0235 protein EV685_3876 n=1 Tax=Sphaerotilus mobilis TaxID=47994 RepID=A0A4Q7L9Z6_9BURK|nr:DUF167 domain-containing protein [Sphaerotilus mobilis]RZS46844.1 hypothetical protein EV685_3876 [Sphaerotilus mobilis]
MSKRPVSPHAVPADPSAPRVIASFLSWPHAGGVLVDVTVVPNARRTEAVGLHDGALRVRLAAPPVDGAANEALQQWLARSLGLPQRAVTLVQGQTSRRKRLHAQANAQAVLGWLADLRTAGVPDLSLPD